MIWCMILMFWLNGCSRSGCSLRNFFICLVRFWWCWIMLCWCLIRMCVCVWLILWCSGCCRLGVISCLVVLFMIWVCSCCWIFFLVSW